MWAFADPSSGRDTCSRRGLRTAHRSRAGRLERRRHRRTDAVGVVAVLAGFVALVVLPQTVDGTWFASTGSTASFTATVVPAPPTNVTATLTCQPGSSTLSITWQGIGWEDGFKIEVYKSNNNGSKHLVATYVINDPTVWGYTVSTTGWASGRYLVVVSGFDPTQTLPAAEVVFQKRGSCA
jgi:hypothetical protein